MHFLVNVQCTGSGTDAGFAARFAQAVGRLATRGVDVTISDFQCTSSSMRLRRLTELLLADSSLTHVWWVSGDVLFPPDAAVHLLEVHRPIVGANYRDPFADDAHFTARKGDIPVITTDGSPALEAVDELGHGCLLVSRAVYERIGPTAYCYGMDAARSRVTGPEESFGHLAGEAGFTLWCDHRLSRAVSVAGAGRWLGYDLANPRPTPALEVLSPGELPERGDGGNAPHRVMIAVPCTRSTKDAFASSLAMAVYSLVMHGVPTHIAICRGYSIPHNRNALVETFLSHPDVFTHLWWIDTDMEFPMNSGVRLIDHQRDIVGVNYRRRIILEQQFTAIKDGAALTTTAQSPDLEACDALGHGCLMVRRGVYERLPRPHYLHTYFTNHDGAEQETSEDVHFCRSAQCPVWCDHKLSRGVLHIGNHGFGYWETPVVMIESVQRHYRETKKAFCVSQSELMHTTDGEHIA